VHTIGIYDFGITPDGAFYYVMELLDGLDLDTFVERFGPVPPPRTVHWLRQACHSLQEAHERGMVHRDVKPANLFVCRLGPDRDFIKVLDFGLVKSEPSPGDDATKLTQEGISFGTPGYMAPEMAMGSQDADARSDIYALGCLGYFLLTGEPVFHGDTPLATVLKHIQEEPTPPSSRSELAIPESLETLILACLAKDPARRPQSAEALAEALTRSLDSGEPWTARMATEWWELHLPQGAMQIPSPQATLS
jgi:serine/threonine-protein kinase